MQKKPFSVGNPISQIDLVRSIPEATAASTSSSTSLLLSGFSPEASSPSAGERLLVCDGRGSFGRRLPLARKDLTVARERREQSEPRGQYSVSTSTTSSSKVVFRRVSRGLESRYTLGKGDSGTRLRRHGPQKGYLKELSTLVVQGKYDPSEDKIRTFSNRLFLWFPFGFRPRRWRNRFPLHYPLLQRRKNGRSNNRNPSQRTFLCPPICLHEATLSSFPSHLFHDDRGAWPKLSAPAAAASRCDGPSQC